jgi:hypothetical protein
MRFFLIDKITRWEVGQCAEALKNVALSEDFFADHFPRRPVMPGVLIVEGMAQLAGLLLEATLKQGLGKEAKAVLTVLERTKFRELVRPGDPPEDAPGALVQDPEQHADVLRVDLRERPGRQRHLQPVGRTGRARSRRRCPSPAARGSRLLPGGRLRLQSPLARIRGA